MTIILIYRPPKPNPAFISEINELLSSVCTTSANTVILGDLNIHVDTPSRQPPADFLQLLDVLNLKQHVDVPTHTIWRRVVQWIEPWSGDQMLTGSQHVVLTANCSCGDCPQY